MPNSMNPMVMEGDGDIDMHHQTPHYNPSAAVPMAAIPSPYQNLQQQPQQPQQSHQPFQSVHQNHHYGIQSQNPHPPPNAPPPPAVPSSPPYQDSTAGQRGQLLFLAEAAEVAERFMDIVTFMSELITKHSGPGFRLTPAEENMLATGLKNVTAQKRDAWRALAEPREDPKEQQLMREYQHQVQVEIYSLCQQVQSLLNILLPNLQQEDSSLIFLVKLQGDYFRYMAEVAPGKGFENKSLESYRRAAKVAETTLSPTDPLRLGVTLNLSVLIFEVLKDRNSAYAAARAAFDNAIPHLDKLDPKAYKDSTLLMQLLRDNLTLWSIDKQQQQQ